MGEWKTVTKILHLAPTTASEDTIRTALEIRSSPADVLGYPDDLSCGPIMDFGRSRTDWSRDHDAADPDEILAFKDCLAEPADKVVVWVGRGSARSWRSCWPFRRSSTSDRSTSSTSRGSGILCRRNETIVFLFSQPARGVSVVLAETLATLVGTERLIGGDVRSEMSSR